MRKKKRKGVASFSTGNWLMRRHSVVLGLGVALAAVLLSGYFIENNSRDRARILRVHGSVSIARGQGTIAPVVGQILNPQDKITTGAGSFIEVTYDETHKDVLRIGSGSKVVLESAVIEKQTNIFMYRGQIMLKLEKLEKGSTFKIRTPTAVAGVRGTSFAVQLTEENTEALITDFESKIFVKGLTEDFVEMKDELLLSDGWKVRVTQFEKPSRIEKITPEEFSSWQAWLDEIAALPRDVAAGKEGFSRLTSYGEAAMSSWQCVLSTDMMRKVTSSPSVLAFLLYVALATNIGRVFLWQANMSKTSI